MRQPHGLPVRMVCDSERGTIRVGSALTTVRPRPNNASDRPQRPPPPLCNQHSVTTRACAARRSPRVHPARRLPAERPRAPLTPRRSAIARSVCTSVRDDDDDVYRTTAITTGRSASTSRGRCCSRSSGCSIARRGRVCARVCVCASVRCSSEARACVGLCVHVLFDRRKGLRSADRLLAALCGSRDPLVVARARRHNTTRHVASASWIALHHRHWAGEARAVARRSRFGVLTFLGARLRVGACVWRRRARWRWRRVCVCVAQLTKDVRKFLQKCLDEGKDFNLTSAIKSRIITDGA